MEFLIGEISFVIGGIFFQRSDARHQLQHLVRVIHLKITAAGAAQAR